ncbi:hypothetical protein K438DRAFT_1615079 [Mycena galopus ATCC 62051]|nr:hypothetical protein K438DRAFT_1615079 [Mycena galopus ATCC 62051]
MQHRDRNTALQQSVSSDTPAAIHHATPAPLPPRSTSNSNTSILPEPANIDIPMSVPISDSGSDSEAPTRTLQLADGKFLSFRESDIPGPPAVSYARNCEDLLHVWNDKFPQWNGTSPLMIKSVPIPLSTGRNQWEGAKKLWFQWKILVQAMSRTSLNELWALYSVADRFGNIKQMKYTPLLKKLEAGRKEENERLAELALGQLTPEQLTYRNDGEHFLMTKPAKIAVLYRKLKGLAVEGEVLLRPDTAICLTSWMLRSIFSLIRSRCLSFFYMGWAPPPSREKI